MHSMKVVLDTNIWVSALTHKGGAADRLVERLKKEATLYVSPFILEEIDDVLSRKKFGLSKEVREAILESIRAATVIVSPSFIPNILKDKDDNHILACAREAEAAALITGDALLLSLGKWKGIAILDMERFVFLANRQQAFIDLYKANSET